MEKEKREQGSESHGGWVWWGLVGLEGVSE